MATFNIDTINTETFEHVLVPNEELYLDSETGKLVKTDVPVSDTDLANKAYVDSAISAAITQLKITDLR